MLRLGIDWRFASPRRLSPRSHSRNAPGAKQTSYHFANETVVVMISSRRGVARGAEFLEGGGVNEDL